MKRSIAEACSDCMVALDGDSLRLIMPGFGSSFWVKDMVSIEAKSCHSSVKEKETYDKEIHIAFKASAVHVF